MSIRSKQLIALIIMVVALVFMVINRFLIAFPSWIVRSVGVIMLVDLLALSFLTVRYQNSNKK